MVQIRELAELLEQACRQPLGSRKELYARIAKAQTYILNVVEGPSKDEPSAGEDLAVWGEADPDLGGVWVPLFSSVETASRYAAVTEAELSAPQEFECVGFASGGAFRVAERIGRFAGFQIDPAGEPGLRLEWEDVRAFAEGRLPAESPRLFELPDIDVALPIGTQCRLGRIDPEVFGFSGRQALFPDLAAVDIQDFRSMAQFEHEDEGRLWAPCRHLARVLARCAREETADKRAAERGLVDVLIAFKMYGDAEAALARIAAKEGMAAYALGRLAEVLLKSGRVNDCVALCENGLSDHPDCLELHRRLVLAHAQLEQLDAAREAASRALERFPEDPTFKKFA